MLSGYTIIAFTFNLDLLYIPFSDIFVFVVLCHFTQHYIQVYITGKLSTKFSNTLVE